MAQSLIEQLQAGAMSGVTPIGELMRKTKLAASKLGVSDLSLWADRELKGYPAGTDVPDYRVVNGRVMFLNPVHGWCPVFGEAGAKRHVRHPVSELEALSQNLDSTLGVSIPVPQVRALWKGIGFECDIQYMVTAVAMRGIVDKVRDVVLDWTIKLEEAGIRGEGMSFSTEETKAAQAMVITNNYHGPVASVTHGTSTIGSIAQTNASPAPQEIADAVASLLAAIRSSESVWSETAEAESVLADAEPDLRRGLVPFGKINTAVDTLTKVSGLVDKAPDVMSALGHLGRMLGLM
jgi:hypothetical protein